MGLFACSQCSSAFRTASALHAHCRDKQDHAYCLSCERLFIHDAALDQHLRTSSLHVSSDTSDSDDSYASESDGSSDDDDVDPYCNSCRRSFVTMEGLKQHLTFSAVHNWCFICSRDFKSANALSNHSNSPVHNAPTHRCPFCTKTCKIPSGTAHHIESGACHHITRHQVTAAVHSMGIVPTISVSRRLEGPYVPPTIVHYSATEQSFNGTAFQCYLCPRSFKSLSSLNTHLNSAAHDDDEFKCPKCKRKFSLISGLIQHIESEVCGAARISQVEDFASDLAGRFSRALKL